MTKTIFAHESGDTFEMQHSLTSTGRDRFAHACKPVAVVSDATRSHERSSQMAQQAHGRYLARTDTTWRAMVEAEAE